MRKFQRFLSYLLSLLAIVSVVFSIYSLTLLNKVETFYRVMFSILLILLLLLLVYTILRKSRVSKKNKSVGKITVITFIFVILNLVIGIIIFKFYNKLSDMSSEEVSFKIVLLGTKEYKELSNIKDKKIGILEDKNDISGYILPMEVIDKYDLDKNNKIVKVSDKITLMSKLLDEELDLIFITDNYKEMFNSIESFNDDIKLYEITTYSKNYEKEDVEEEIISTKKETKDPFTILLLGVDSTEDSIKNSNSYNGDTIMLLAVDPNTLHMTMFSIPRDTYVTMACGGKITKINHAGWSGTSCMVKTVEKFTGIDVDYYAKINFKGVVDLVNIVGGVEVDVPMKFCEQNSNREFGDSEICLDKGVQQLDGEEALAFARHRKTLPLGDFQRGQNQQLVVEALIQSAKSIRKVSDLYNILDTVSKNLETNMSTDEMLSLYNVLKKLLLKSEDVNLNITKTYLTGYDLYVYDGGNSYTFQYYKQSLKDITDAMKENLGLKEKVVVKTFNFSINKPYEKTIIGKKDYKETKKELVPDLTTYTLSEAKSWANKHNIDLTINYVESTSSSYKNDQITYQDVHSKALLEKYDKISINVIKKVDKKEKIEEIE